MKVITFLRDTLINFIIVFIVYSLVTFLYNWIAHNNPSVDWEVTIRFTVIFGLILSIVKLFNKKK